MFYVLSFKFYRSCNRGIIAGFLLDSESPIITILSILMEQAKYLHTRYVFLK